MLIFYNQKNLYLQGSSFIRDLSDIISIILNTQIKDEQHENEIKQNITFNKQLKLPNQKISIPINQCLFNDVKTFRLSIPHHFFLNSFVFIRILLIYKWGKTQNK
mgnify:FL=1